MLPLYLVGQALWLAAVPASVLGTRAFSICWGVLALFAFHRSVTRLVPDGRVAWLATGLLSLDYNFIDNAGFARPDIMCLALGWSALAVYLNVRERRLATALFWSNLLLAACALTHPNALLHLAGLLVLVLIYDRGRLDTTCIVAGLIPYLLLGGLYGIYILRDPAAWFDQVRINGTNGRWAETLNPLRLLASEIVQRYLVAYGFLTEKTALLKSLSLFSFLGAFIGIAVTPALRRKLFVRTLLTLCGLYFVILCVFNQKLSYYLVHIIPLYVTAFSLWWLWLWDRFPRWRAGLALWALLLALLPAGGILLRAHLRNYRPAESAVLEFLRVHKPAAKSIIGTAGLLYDMHFDKRLTDDLRLGINSGRRPEVIIVAPIYAEIYAAWPAAKGSEIRAIRARLAEYQLAYDASGYRIYFAAISP